MTDRVSRAQSRFELHATHLAVAEDLGKQSRPEGLSGMHRNHGSFAIVMTEEVMTALRSNDLEADL
jgi:hypothetical protein